MSTTLQAASTLLRQLEADGWTATDGLGAVQMRSPWANEHSALLAMLEHLGPIASDTRLIARHGSDEVTFRWHQGGLSIASLPDVSPTAMFDERPDQRLAEELWAGESTAAFSLPFDWSGEAEVVLADLVPSTDLMNARVALRVETIVHEFQARPYWEVGELLPLTGVRRLLIALDAPDGTVNLGALTLAGPTVDIACLPLGVTSRVERSELRLEVPGLPATDALLPLEGDAPTSEEAAQRWEPLTGYLGLCAGATAWCELASEVRLQDGAPQLSFRGYRKITVALQTPPISRESVLQLHSWVFAEPSPDRQLAVQQVASLQDPDKLLTNVADLRGSAEIVYAGLRNDAVADAVKGYRDAHAGTLDTVRQTLKGVQDLTKAATDRAFAALVAVGGILVAKAGTSLPDNASHDLLHTVAVFLIALAAFSVLIEGPLLNVTLKNLKTDLRLGSPLLSLEQTDALANMKTVKTAKCRATVVRIIVPVMYVGFAVGILILAVPARYNP